MATPKPGKELHQLKLKLTKDPRATTVKLPTPTKQHPPGHLGATSSSDQPRAPAAKVLKLSDVIVVPAKSPGTPPVPTKHVPIKPAFKAVTATSVTQQSSTAFPQTVKLPKQQQQVTLVSPPIVVKSPKKKTMLVNPQVLKQVKQQAASANPVDIKSPQKVHPQVLKQVKQQAASANPIVIKSPQKVHPQVLKQVKQQAASANPIVIKSPQKARPPGLLAAGGEASTKHKPPPLVLQPQPKQESKQKHKKSSSQSILPTSRVRTIMKTNIKSSTSDGPLNISQDSVAVISKATVSSSCL